MVKRKKTAGKKTTKIKRPLKRSQSSSSRKGSTIKPLTRPNVYSRPKVAPNNISNTIQTNKKPLIIFLITLVALVLLSSLLIFGPDFVGKAVEYDIDALNVAGVAGISLQENQKLVTGASELFYVTANLGDSDSQLFSFQFQYDPNVLTYNGFTHSDYYPVAPPGAPSLAQLDFVQIDEEYNGGDKTGIVTITANTVLPTSLRDYFSQGPDGSETTIVVLGGLSFTAIETIEDTAVTFNEFFVLDVNNDNIITQILSAGFEVVPPEVCNDGVDNDKDGDIDCDDEDCSSDPECPGFTIACQFDDGTPMECGNDPIGGGLCGTCPVDDYVCEDHICVYTGCVADCTYKECGDDGCGGSCGGCVLPGEVCDLATFSCVAGEKGYPGATDACYNQIDDDNNGKTDCEDITCAFESCSAGIGCQCVYDYDTDIGVFTESLPGCDDGNDNDGDGLIDCADPDCDEAYLCGDSSCEEGEDGVVTVSAPGQGTESKSNICFDGDTIKDYICEGDNLGYFEVDCPENQVCQMVGDAAACVGSIGITESCDSGEDEDSDGFVDCADPDCVGQGPCVCVDNDNTYDGNLEALGLDGEGNPLYDQYDPNSLKTASSVDTYYDVYGAYHTEPILDECGETINTVREAYCLDSIHSDIGTFACEFGCENNACIDLNPCEDRECGINLNNNCGYCVYGRACNVDGTCINEEDVVLGESVTLDELFRCPIVNLVENPLAEDICLSVDGCNWLADEGVCISQEWFSVGGIALDCASYTGAMSTNDDTYNAARADSCVAPCEFVDVESSAEDSCYLPNCVNKECGDDEFGGSCGVCSSDEQCLDYQCVTQCEDSDVDEEDPSLVIGSVTWINDVVSETTYDSCEDQWTVIEGTCESNVYSSESISCNDLVCVDGQCTACTSSSQCAGDNACVEGECVLPDFRLEDSDFVFGEVSEDKTSSDFSIHISGEGKLGTIVPIVVDILEYDQEAVYSTGSFDVPFGELYDLGEMNIPSEELTDGTFNPHIFVEVVIDRDNTIIESDENNAYSFSKMPTVETNCNDGVDDDADQMVDYADLDCWYYSGWEQDGSTIVVGDVNQDDLVNNDDWAIVEGNINLFWTEVVQENFALLNQYMWEMEVNWND